MFRSESCEHKMRSSCTKIDRRYFCLPGMTREENSWGLVITIPCRSLRSSLFVFVFLWVKGRRSKVFNVYTLHWTRKQNNTIQKESLSVRINDRQKVVFFFFDKESVMFFISNHFRFERRTAIRARVCVLESLGEVLEGNLK